MPAYLLILRPKQWIKNGFVLAPIFFAMQFQSWQAWQAVLLAALAFALVASSVYIINDVVDRGEDRHHPVKSRRPIAAGIVSVPRALALAFVLLLCSMVVLNHLPLACSGVMAFYLAANIIYTFKLKHYALLDVFFIASCFVLRVLMGCFALAVIVSPWIILTTFMLALFLGFGKRYHELGIENYAANKQNLQHYNRDLLDRLVVICAAAALVCYAIYTTEVAHKLDDVAIVYTVVFVAFGLFRYLQSLYVYGKGGEPETIILKDWWQLINVALWLLSTLWVLG